MDYWMENAMQPGKHVLVDCGTWGDQTTQERFKRLREHVALSNCLRVGNDRLVVRLPQKKAPQVLETMPDIQAGAADYCWCTHGFVQPNTNCPTPRRITPEPPVTEDRNEHHRT